MKTPQKISLVTQTADILREQIMTGNIAHTMPGEHKLAKDLQISRKTIRAALEILTNEKIIAPSIPGARRKISQSPTLPRPTTSRVGVLLPKPLDEFHASSQDLFRAFRKFMEARHVDLTFYDFPFQKGTPSKQKITELLQSNPNDAWLVFEITPLLSQLMVSMNLAVVACGGNTPKTIYNVAYDGASGIQHAIHKLIHAGHTRICHPIEQHGRLHPSFPQLLENKGIEVDEHLHFPIVENSRDGYVSLLKRLFSRQSPPTGMILGGPQNLLTVITWLGTQQLTIPDDVSILYIGSDPILSSIVPQIDHYSTSYAPLVRELDRAIGCLLENPNLTLPNKTFFMDYIPGSSLAPPKEN